jgi:hypothetical protein
MLIGFGALWGPFIDWSSFPVRTVIVGLLQRSNLPNVNYISIFMPILSNVDSL